MPPPTTTTSKRWPAIASIASARESIGSVEEEGRLLDRGALGRLLLLARPAQVQEADEALGVGQADRAAAAAGAQQTGGAPVAGEAAGVGAEQDDVGGDRGRVQVLLVLDRVGAERAGDDDEGRGAVELGRALGAGGLLEAGEGPRPEHAEAPRRGQVVVGGPAGEVEQLEQLRPLQRLGPERLVRAARPDRGLDLHGDYQPKRRPSSRGAAAARAVTARPIPIAVHGEAPEPCVAVSSPLGDSASGGAVSPSGATPSGTGIGVPLGTRGGAPVPPPLPPLPALPPVLPPDGAGETLGGRVRPGVAGVGLELGPEGGVTDGALDCGWRGGGAIGSESPEAATSTSPVTQTEVWSLDCE